MIVCDVETCYFLYVGNFNIPLMIVRLDHFVIIFTYKKFNLLDLVCRKVIWLKLKKSVYIFIFLCCLSMCSGIGMVVTWISGLDYLFILPLNIVTGVS